MDFKTQFALQLEKLKKKDPEFEVFGSAAHEYNFGSKLQESNILAFEKKYGCKLPLPYKIFLTEFGNGGAGPFFGIFALGCMDNGFDEDPWPNYIKPGANFRFTEAHNNDAILFEGEPRREIFPSKKEYEDAYDLWQDEFGEARYAKYYENHSLDGAIPICHHGCALRSWLVVDEKSPEFGNIWHDYVADNLGVEPAVGYDGGRVDFAEWILAWCNKSILELENNTQTA